MARKITRDKNGGTYYNGVTGRRKVTSLFGIMANLPKQTKKTSGKSKHNNISYSYSTNSLQNNNDNGCFWGTFILFAIVLLMVVFFFANFVKTCTSGSRHHPRRHRRHTMINYNAEKQPTQSCYFITTKQQQEYHGTIL